MSDVQLKSRPAWECVNLKDVAEIASGVAKGRRFNGAMTVTVPYLRVANVQAGHLDLSEIKEIEVLPTDVEKCRLQPGDVLMTEGGDRDKLGRGTIWQGEVETCIHQNHIFRVRPDRSRLLPEYLNLYLGTPDAKSYFLRAAKQTTGIASINMTQLSAFPVSLPPLREQRRIAAILDKADAIRRKREEGIRLTEELLRSSFLEMFGDPAKNPKGWETEKLGELASIRRGSSPRPIENYMGGDVPWIKIGDATKGDSFYITDTKDHVTQAGAEKSVLLEPGALVIANSGVSLGFARILKIKGCVHDGWLSLENLDDRLNKIYLLRLVNCLTEHFRAIAPDGTQPNLNTGIMKEFRVAIPPIDLQRQFERSAYAIVEMTAARKKATIEAQALFDSLVQRAFRGEL